MTDPDLADATYIEPITPDWSKRSSPGSGPTPCCRPWAARRRSTSPWRSSARRAGTLRGRADRRHRRSHRQGRGPRDIQATPWTPSAWSARERAPSHSLDEALRRRCERRSACPRSSAPPSPWAAPAAASPTTARNSRESSSAAWTLRPTHEVLIEESVLGWKEFELEVMRDGPTTASSSARSRTSIPMGVHTGDSITVAPALTLTDKEYQRMRDAPRSR